MMLVNFIWISFETICNIKCQILRKPNKQELSRDDPGIPEYSYKCTVMAFAVGENWKKWKPSVFFFDVRW